MASTDSNIKYDDVSNHDKDKAFTIWKVAKCYYGAYIIYFKGNGFFFMEFEKVLYLNNHLLL